MTTVTVPEVNATQGQMLTPKDWTLMVIAAARGRAVEPVQLQKALFLLSRQLTPSQLRVRRFYDFAPYDYGPFSREVYDDAEQLEREGLIHVERPPQARFNLYAATEAGLERAAQLNAQLSAPVRVHLRSVVDWATSLTFTELVSAIYTAYPDMKENSVFQG
jgi:uncharacterized protein YwgA